MKKGNSEYVFLIALIVALGGLLMGFDASVISGVVGFIKVEFDLSTLQLGWSVASLTVASTMAMFVAGPLSDRFGRRAVLRIAAILYAISALASALAPDYTTLVIARMIGGFGVGASLILAPLYIAEIAPKDKRGRLVSFNQLNIVIGISLAFFSNYWILQLGKSDAAWVQDLGIDQNNWRWMLGLEALPAILYFFGLFMVPRSPRWLMMKGNNDEAQKVMSRVAGQEKALEELDRIRKNIEEDSKVEKASLGELFKPGLRLVITIGVVVGILQQITGINAVFFYAPMIFEQSGLGTDAAFMQAILVGLVNLVFTILAILFIDRLGRKPLLTFGVAGITISMLVLSYGFNKATYSLDEQAIASLEHKIQAAAAEEGQELKDFDDWTEAEKAALVQDSKIKPMLAKDFNDGDLYLAEVAALMPNLDMESHRQEFLNSAIHLNTYLILVALLAFVASFAISIGPVMWVLFSELFPNRIRGIAISFVGVINSLVSTIVQFVFPWELETIGSSLTFLLFGLFAFAGLIFIIRSIPETKGRSLEELEKILIKED